MASTNAFPCYARPETGPIALLHAEKYDGTTEALGLATGYSIRMCCGPAASRRSDLEINFVTPS